MPDPHLFPPLQLSDALVRDLRRLNPWWERGAPPVLPSTRRHIVGWIHRRLEQRLAAIVVVRGPRQIGKTTAQLQVLSDLLEKGVTANCILRVQADELSELTRLSEPILRVVDWFDTIVSQRNERTGWSSAKRAAAFTIASSAKTGDVMACASSIV